MSILTSSGELTYNDKTFTSLHKSRIRGDAVWDEAGRTIKWIAWRLDVTAYISYAEDDDADNVEDIMEDYRHSLMSPGKGLVYTGKGFGSLTANINDITDVNWGPKPQSFSFTPIGGTMTALIEWSCITYLPECANASYVGVAEFNYEISFDIDREGFTSRSIHGHLVIAQTRNFGNAQRVADNADNYRYLVRPNVPLGYHRENQTFRCSMDKNRLDFTFVDRQLKGGPLPPFVAAMEIEQHLTSDLSKGFIEWINRLSGSVTLPAGVPKYRAYQAFTMVLINRAVLTNKPKGAGQGGILDAVNDFLPGIGGRDPLRILQNVSISDQIFGNVVRFDMTWHMIGSTLENFLIHSGMWKPIIGTSFATWRKTLEDNAFHERGQSGLGISADDDTIVDLCVNMGDAPGQAEAGAELKPAIFRPAAKKPTDEIKVDKSWVGYENHLNIQETPGDVVLIPLPQQEPKQGLNAFVEDAFKNGGEKPIVQHRVQSKYTIVMSGNGMRVGHPVAVPRLVAINGKKVLEISKHVFPRTARVVGGVAINQCHWLITYIPSLDMKGQEPKKDTAEIDWVDDPPEEL